VSVRGKTFRNDDQDAVAGTQPGTMEVRRVGLDPAPQVRAREAARPVFDAHLLSILRQCAQDALDRGRHA
jgi:hypothetical protein